MHGLQFQTPFSRLSPGPLPLACLFVWLSAMTDYWGTFSHRAAFRNLGTFSHRAGFRNLHCHLSMFFPWCRYYIPTCLCVSIDWSQPSFVSIERLSLSSLPQMHGLQFQTPFSRLSPGPLPLACLFVWLSAMTDYWGTFSHRAAFRNLGTFSHRAAFRNVQLFET